MGQWYTYVRCNKFYVYLLCYERVVRVIISRYEEKRDFLKWMSVHGSTKLHER
jgi:hypothetical protein